MYPPIPKQTHLDRGFCCRESRGGESVPVCLLCPYHELKTREPNFKDYSKYFRQAIENPDQDIHVFIPRKSLKSKIKFFDNLYFHYLPTQGQS